MTAGSSTRSDPHSLRKNALFRLPDGDRWHRRGQQLLENNGTAVVLLASVRDSSKYRAVSPPELRRSPGHIDTVPEIRI